MQVSAKRRDSDREVVVEYHFGDTVEELVENFGEDIIFQHARGSLTVSLQSYIRSQIDAEKSDEEIQDAADQWRPGQRRKAKSKADKVLEELSNMSEEERLAVLQKYRSLED